MIAANPGFRPPVYVDDSWGSHNARSGIPCPACKCECWLECEGRHFRPPSYAWLWCPECDAWYDLGQVDSHDPLYVEAVARKRASAALAKHYRQATLEGYL